MSIRDKKRQELTAFDQLVLKQYDLVKSDPELVDLNVEYLLRKNLSALAQDVRRRGHIPLLSGRRQKQETVDRYDDLAHRKILFDQLTDANNSERVTHLEARKIAFQNVDDVTTDKVLAGKIR